MRWLIPIAFLFCHLPNTLIANEVEAVISGGHLYVYGDSNDNTISIFSTSPGQIHVVGASNSSGQPTFVNGQSNGSIVLNGWNGGIYAYLRDGNDDVTLHDVNVPGVTHFDMGNGNDGLHVGQTPWATASILASGFSSLVMTGESQMNSAFRVVGTGGNDSVDINGVSVAGRTTVNLGSGIDALTIGEVEATEKTAEFFGPLVVYPGSDRDDIDIFAISALDNVTVDDGTGRLNLHMVDSNINKDLTVNGSSVADSVEILNVSVLGKQSVSTSDGNDTIYLTGEAMELRVDGGAGSDQITIENYSADTLRTYLGVGSDTLKVSNGDFNFVFGYASSGNDNFTYELTTADEVTLYGDGGTDSLTQSSNAFGSIKTYSIEIQ